MIRGVFAVVAVLLIGASLFLTYRCLSSLALRDYVAALLLGLLGIGLLRSGVELARSSLGQ